MTGETYIILREGDDGSITVKARTGCRHRDMTILLLLLEHEADATTELVDINQKYITHAVYGNIGEVRKTIYSSSEFEVDEPKYQNSCTKEDVHYVGPSVYGKEGELRHVLLNEC